jgi:hypothetical protein
METRTGQEGKDDKLKKGYELPIALKWSDMLHCAKETRAERNNCREKSEYAGLSFTVQLHSATSDNVRS